MTATDPTKEEKAPASNEEKAPASNEEKAPASNEEKAPSDPRLPARMRLRTRQLAIS